MIADALAFGPHGVDYYAFIELAAKIGIEFAEAVAMRAIRCVNTKIKIKIKRKNYRPFAGRAVARMLDVTAEERWLCEIQTIAAVDETEAQAEARRREDRRAWDRARDRRRRAAAGATPRHQSLSATRPWEAFGVCRRTWERRGKPEPGFLRDRRPDAPESRAAGAAPSPPLRSEDPQWAALPVAGGSRPAAVPDARLCTWRWRT